jgi:hypothetical protein
MEKSETPGWGFSMPGLDHIVAANFIAPAAHKPETPEYFGRPLSLLGSTIDTAAEIQLKPLNRYEFVLDYSRPSYVFDLGIRWEDYTGDFPKGIVQPLRGYMHTLLKKGARNPYRGDNWSDEVSSHEARHAQHPAKSESQVRREERMLGWGHDYAASLLY